MNLKRLLTTAVVLFATVNPLTSWGQAIISEDFTGTGTTNNWFFFNGACLTAGTSTSLSSPGPVPGCTTVLNSYYALAKDHDAAMVGGYSGYLGSSTAPASASAQVADPIITVNGSSVGQGALRFTNGYPYGHNQSGAIVSAFTVPSGSGLEITFKTTTYLGDSGGGGRDGADGMSFYLLDGCMPLDGNTSSIPGSQTPAGCTTSPIYGSGKTFPGIGAFGGSLAYTCSNTNSPYNGLTGGYLGVGVDEYGNFLNGSSNTLAETGSTSTNGGNGDNTASGGLYQPGRIGLRGAGSISWKALTSAYGSNLGSSTPYYPASLATTCSNGGAYNSGSDTCGTACPAGYSYDGGSGKCVSCASGYTYNGGTCKTCPSPYVYDSASDSCLDTTTSTTAYTCAAGGPFVPATNSCTTICTTGFYNSGSSKCNVCNAGQTFDLAHGTSSKPCAACTLSGVYNSGTGKCSKGVLSFNSPKTTSNPNVPTIVKFTTQSPGTTSLVSGVPYARNATQKACQTGHLYNYADPNNPLDLGAASLSNSANTAGILDYPAIPGAYSVLGNVQIANESATTRAAATPIFYDVKITQDGLLTFAYSLNGMSYNTVIARQPIAASNGPLPPYLRFGFAGSTGGSTNVHEIMCFKSAPADQSGSSTTVNERQSAKIIENTTQAYFAYYNPNDSTGRLTANFLATDTSGNIVVNSVANWDGQCVLSGVSSSQSCLTTNVPGPTTAQSPDSRVMLTYSGSQGIPFQWGNLSSTQQQVLTNLDATQTSDRLKYLRGDRSKEINSVGVGSFRARDGVLGDIVDASPTWVGPPQSPYTAKWSDRLYPTATTPENTATYLDFTKSFQTRQNVVYAGSNDGFLHGFRTGTFDSAGNFAKATNDGQEVFAYMPAAVLQTIHTVSQTPAGVIDGTLDFANTQYLHNFYVDAPPGTGDLFYAGAWHSWVVGGIGPGGSAIYALDVTDPSTFAESNAKTLVIGEWTPASIQAAGGCVNDPNCDDNLGNTYGIPQIRRLHDGKWGVIFGNGLGSGTGDAGIYVMTVEPSDGTTKLYYFSTGALVGNGIAYVAPADLDGDHVTDYVYAGDLQGNVWKFDLTDSSEANWGAVVTAPNSTPTPLFTTPNGQPITTRLVVASGIDGGGVQRLVLSFGTGQKTPYTPTSATSYAGGTQSFYGVWDWNMASWNGKGSVKYASLDSTATGLPAVSAPYNVVHQSSLTQQVITINNTTGQTAGDRDIQTNAVVCWAGSSVCAPAGANVKFGWYFDLPGTSEQIIYNPQVVGSAVTVNSIVPANNIPTACTLNTDKGYTYVVSVLNGGAFKSVFPNYNDTGAIGVETDATGTSFVVQNSAGATFLVYQTVTNSHGTLKLDLPPNTKVNRLTWVQLR